MTGKAPLLSAKYPRETKGDARATVSLGGGLGGSQESGGGDDCGGGDGEDSRPRRASATPTNGGRAVEGADADVRRRWCAWC